MEANGFALKKISEIGRMLSLHPDTLIPYGHYKAKIPLDIIYEKPRRAKLVLMTSINPTPFGEGKTTMSIGLAQAMTQIGWQATAVLREPSLGPTLGMKGGATGGGQSQVLPAQDINLHFTGDFHAITSAHNLLAALIDNALYFNQGPRIKATNVLWPRALDMNDRALRHIVVGLGGTGQGVPRESGFVITAASEVMAVLSLARDLSDLQDRLNRMVIAMGPDKGPVTVADLGAAPAMTALLEEAIMPNLVQTSEHTPAIIHGGPFANVAHGCNSIIATEAGLRLSEVVITEAGFGADLGAEKFLDIKAPLAGLEPDVAVVVVTLRAIAYQGGNPSGDGSDLGALARGYANLQKHVDNLHRFGLNVIVGINRFSTDSSTAIAWLQNRLAQDGVASEVAEVFRSGGQGGMSLARLVASYLQSPHKTPVRPLYSPSLPLKDKIERIAAEIYGAGQVDYSEKAQKQLDRYEAWGEGTLSVCMAKTQYSLSDDPRLLGRPEGFTLHIREVEIARGAGFVVPIAGSLVRMPGLPKNPAAFGVQATPTPAKPGR